MPPQNLNAFVTGRLQAQLAEQTVRTPHKRFFGGPLALPASPAAKPTTIAMQRLLLQSEEVARELSLGGTFAGPGVVQ